MELTHKYMFRVDALNSKSRADQLKSLLRVSLEKAPGVQQTEMNAETRVLKIASSDALDVDSIKAQLNPHSFHLHEIEEKDLVKDSVLNVCVAGMTCQSCEMIIERKWKDLPGVNRVDVSATNGKARLICHGATPSLEDLQKSLGEEKYVVHLEGISPQIKNDRPSILQLAGLFALVLIVGKIFSNLGLLNNKFSIGAGMGFGAIFVVGLVAASSSCIAVAGGLLLSSASKFNEHFGGNTGWKKMRPALLFVLGRIISYTVLGGLLGLVGKALTPSPVFTAGITILAALYMLTMGLDMLRLAPAWLKKLTPKMPKALSRKVINDADSKGHLLAPALLGGATFFLPCGFTQALQLYALTTGSFWAGAVSLLAFALGTAPALLALGWASSSLKGKLGNFFFKFSGALVIVLGLWNIQNGLTILGYPLSWPKFNPSNAGANLPPTNDPNVTFDGKTQTMRMVVDGGYSPSQFTIKAGVPTRWEVTAKGSLGCLAVLQSRQLGINKLLQASSPNVIEFTATTPGTYQFSCSMGMYRGQITVIGS